jgi:hypothetical protein
MVPKKPTDLCDRIEALLLRQEVRRRAEGLDDAALEALYRQGDATVRAALEELPSIRATEQGIVTVRPFVSRELSEGTALEAARKQDPETAATLDDLALEARIVGTFEGALRTSIAEELGVEAAPGNIVASS